ncbi:MAG: hypothetical protein HZB53_20450 [Chloroflexi bacterium]|nr:hypothetical protein [Chloroflexota bacterium]
MLLAIDLGTAALKAGLFDADGHPRRVVRHAYPLQRTADGGAEQHAADWWSALCDATAELFAHDRPGDVTAVCVIGQGPTLVICDDDLRDRAPALTWADTRDHAERRRLSAMLGYDVSTYALLPRISWLAQAQPAAFGPGAHVMQAYDFIAARLAGGPFASQFGAWPPFSTDEFARAGLDPAWIPPVHTMGTVVGVTRGAWHAQSHLPAGIPVIAGVYDSVSTTIGAALVERGRACDFGGGSGGFGVVCDAPLSGPGVGAWPGVVDGQHLIGGATASAGLTMDWFARTFGGREEFRSTLAQAADVPSGAEGLIFLPYLAGERAPLWDDELRGAFVGLALHHRRPHLARAVCEGIACGLRHIAQIVAAAGGHTEELRVCGGTARYELLNQIKADVLGVPVLVPRVVDASLLGAAIIAAVGTGRYADYASAAERMVHIERGLRPDERAHTVHDAQFDEFLRLTALRIR